MGSLECAPLSNQRNCKAQVWGLKLSLFLYLSPGLFILWDLLWVVFLPSPSLPRPATLGTALVEGAGLVSPQSSQSQGPVCQKFLLLVPPREKEEQERSVFTWKRCFSALSQGEAFLPICEIFQEWEIHSLAAHDIMAELRKVSAEGLVSTLPCPSLDVSSLPHWESRQ